MSSMVSAYIAIVIFAVMALLEPLLMLLTSIMIRRGAMPSRVKKSNYESAEESRGSRTTVMSEYLYYFPMFLAFEIITAVMLIWVTVARASAPLVNYAILGLFIFGFVFEVFVIALAKSARE